MYNLSCFRQTYGTESGVRTTWSDGSSLELFVAIVLEEEPILLFQYVILIMQIM